MADTSGVDSTLLELYLEFEDNLDDSGPDGRDQSPASVFPVFVTDGAVDKGARFSGVSNGQVINTGVAALGDASLFADSGEAWSIAFWGRTVGSVSGGVLDGTVVARRRNFTGGGGNLLQVHFNQGTLRVDVRGAITYYVVPDMRDGDWHHYAITWDGTDLLVYLDGTVNAVEPTIGALSEVSTVPITIAGYYASSVDSVALERFGGELDSFRVYSEALTPVEIGLLLQQGGVGGGEGTGGIVPSDLELLLEFEDDLDDGSPHGRDQTLTGTGSFVDGQIGQAAEWVNDGYINTGVTELGDASLIADTGEAWSVTGWVNTNDIEALVGVQSTVLAKWNTGVAADRTLRIYITYSGATGAHIMQVGARNGTDTTISAAGGFEPNTWHHFAVTWDGTTLRGYWNGNFVTNITPGSAATNGANILIGAQGPTSGVQSKLRGRLDDLRVYSRAITTDEIEEIVEAQITFTATLSLVGLTGTVGNCRVTFGEDIDNATLIVADFTVVNGTVSNIVEVSSTVFSFDVTPAADGVVSVELPGGSVTSATSSAVNSASNSLTWGTAGVDDPDNGGIMRFDRTATRAFTASIIIGPLGVSSNAMLKSMLQRLLVTFGSDTDATGNVNLAMGIDGDDAISRILGDDGQYSASIATLLANNGLCIPRIAGGALVVEIDVSSGHCVFEQAVGALVPAGRNRAVRYSS